MNTAIKAHMLTTLITAALAVLWCHAPDVARAENKVDVRTVGDYIGQEVVFTGVVELARRIDSGTQFLDFGGRHPNAMFTCVVFASKADLFGDISNYEGKTVRVRGVVDEFNGKPQIVLKAPDQLEVIADAPSNGQAPAERSSPASQKSDSSTQQEASS